MCRTSPATVVNARRQIAEKYHTESAAAYREHMARLARGEPTTLVPVKFEVKAAAAPVAKTMQAFGSGPPPAEEGMAGLDSLLSGFGSLSGLAGAAAASYDYGIASP